jgi:hypothetical protein
MPEFTLTVKHGRTLEGARQQLETVINEVRSRFGPMIQRVEWSPDRNQVKVYATGAELDMRIDPVEVHVVGNILGVLGMLSSPLLLGFQGIFQRSFPKSLPSH